MEPNETQGTNTSVTPQVATGQGDTTPLAPETQQDGQPQDANQQAQPEPQSQQPGPVPYERFTEINERMKQAEERARQYEQYLLNQQQQPQQPQQQQQGQPSQQDVLAQAGLQPEDLYTQEGLQRYTNTLMQMSQQTARSMVQEVRNEFAAMMNQSKVPDLGTVVGMRNPVTGQFQYGQALQTYINAHPDQAQAVAYMAQLPQTQTIVYQLITNDPAFQAQRQQQTTQQVQQQVQQINNRPVSASELSQAGNLDEVEVRKNWTDAQVAAHVEQMRQQAG